jgi:hypothetical protein
MNANDARIPRLFVTQTNGLVQDDSPNAPASGVGSPAGDFDPHLQAEHGASVGGGYQLIIRAYDVTTGDNNAALDPPAGPLNGPANFAVAPWTPSLGDQVFDQKGHHPRPRRRRRGEPHLLLHGRAGEQQSPDRLLHEERLLRPRLTIWATASTAASSLGRSFPSRLHRPPGEPQVSGGPTALRDVCRRAAAR